MRQVFSAIGTIMRQKGLFSWRWRGQRKSMACNQRRVQSTLSMWWVWGWRVLVWIGDGGKPPPARLLSHATIRRSAPQPLALLLCAVQLLFTVIKNTPTRTRQYRYKNELKASHSASPRCDRCGILDERCSPWGIVRNHWRTNVGTQP